MLFTYFEGWPFLFEPSKRGGKEMAKLVRALSWAGVLVMAVSGCSRELEILTPADSRSPEAAIGTSAEELNELAREAHELWLAEVFSRGDGLPECPVIDLSYYSQLDLRWRYQPLGYDYCHSSTIGISGSHLTCLAMLYDYWGYPLTPQELNDWQAADNDHYAFSQQGCGDRLRLPQALHYGGVRRPYRYLGPEAIYHELRAGHPVVAELNIGNLTGHFVIAYAFDGQNILVTDPLGLRSRKLYGQILSLRVYGF